MGVLAPLRIDQSFASGSIVNDPYTGGTHLSDVGIIKPIFVDGELLAFGIAVAHWTEIGGSVPGSLSPKATEIFHEGLRFPGLRIYREGERQDDLFDLIAANVRGVGLVWQT